MSPWNRPIRLTAVLTHPVQYSAPWFRHIAARCPEIDLTVLYATQPAPEQQGVGFGTAFEWDAPLTEGYACRVLRPARARDSVHSGRFWGLSVPEMTGAVLDSRPDVALVPGWHSVTLLRAVGACRRAGIPVLYRGDTHLGSAPAGWRRLLWAPRTWALLRLFDGYLCVGRRARAYLERFGAAESRIWSVPHCVDNDFFARAASPYQSFGSRAAARQALGLGAGDFVVLFVGKVDANKRVLDLVRAVSRLGPRASLLVAGSGDRLPECRREAERLGARAAWAGFLNQGELGRAYGVADCLAMPSHGETWGLAVNEAMAAGLPSVVSSAVGCAPDLIVTGSTGETFPVGDVEALAAALERVRRRGEAGQDWAAACRERVQTYSFEQATAGLLEACRAVTAPRSSRARAGRGIPRVVACCGGMVAVSGLERMTFEVLRALRERGAAVHCIVNSWENHRIVPLAERVGATWSTGSYHEPLSRRIRNPIRAARIVLDILKTSAGLMRDARRFRATHVLVPEFTTALRNAPALAVLRLFGVRVVLRLGNAPEPAPFYRRLWRWSIDPVVDRFVCNSRFTQRELLAHGISPRKVLQIYNTVPTRDGVAQVSGGRDPRKLIYVGQVIPEKGLDVLLDAVGILVGAGHDVRLDVVGDMEGWVSGTYTGYREKVRERAAAPDLAGRVSFLGHREDVPDLLAGAGVHCCPSQPAQREGFGVVNIEAKQAGIPSVVFPTGALPELIAHGTDGWMCASPTAAALAEGIEYFLADPDRLDRAGRAARASLEPFNRERFTEAWWRVFRIEAGDTAGSAEPVGADGRRESGARHA
jgi:glycosyltransferase involved in cell wall biosynthesis